MPSAISRGFRWGTAIILAGALSSVHAQDSTNSTRQIRRDCQEDYAKFCSGGEADSVLLEKACLRQSYANLSGLCKRALRNPPADSE